MDNRGAEGRIQDPLPKEAPSFVRTVRVDSHLFRKQSNSSAGASRSDAVKSGDRNSREHLFGGILQQAISGTKELGGVETRAGRKSSEQIRKQSQVCYGDSSVSPSRHQTGGLDGVDRPAGRLFPRPNPPGLQEIPEICSSVKNVSVQSTLFWTKHGSLRFHSSGVERIPVVTSGRGTDFDVPGRLDNQSQVASKVSGGPTSNYDVNTTVGAVSKPRQITTDSFTRHHLPGDEDSVSGFSGFSSPESHSRVLKKGEALPREMDLLGEGMDESAGDPLLDRAIRLPGKTTPSSTSVSSSKLLDERPRPRDMDSDSSGNQGSFELVGRSQKTSRGPRTSTEKPRSSVVFRRIGRGMGCNAGEGRDLWSMARSSKRMAYQYEGADGHSSSPSALPGGSQEQGSSGQCGQHHGVGLHKETVRHSFGLPLRDSKGSLIVGEREEHYASNSLHRRREERQGGSPQQRKTGSHDGADPASRGMQQALGTMGRTDNRPLCDAEDKEATCLLLTNPRPGSSGSGHFPHGLGKTKRVRLPPIQDPRQSPEKVQGIGQRPDDINSSVLANETLDHGGDGMAGRHPQIVALSERSTQTATLREIPSKSPRSQSNCLFTIEKLARAKGFSREAARAIARARRTSTIKLYQSKWDVFREWCRIRNISSSNTSIIQIADFLLLLRSQQKLAVSTIKGYRSMLTSIFRHRNIDVSGNKDLSDLIRSFETAKRKDNPTPSWNLDVVLSFLTSSRFEPLDKASWKDLTKKTLFLVALATAKRIGELQAFSKNVGFSGENAVCSLQLGFLAKNENPSHPWPRSFTIPGLSHLVGQEKERGLCPVRALKFYLQKTKHLRGQTDNLWCSVKKPSLPLSKNALAFFIKDLIREAHQNCDEKSFPILKVKAHEVRAVVTSMAYRHNKSMKAILEATFWRSKSIFADCYLKEVQTQYEDCCSLGPYVASGAVVGEGATASNP
ncbi:uncharacterized protein LOC135225407 [Macrobrachium nipponense]|uniref:uncharacterized protein LOC135225407 n=1 Tax=Macrobrachium nipponense TaxID=159736 RepID=UPI0030C7E091